MRRVSPFGKLLSAVLFTALCVYLIAHLYSLYEESGIVSLGTVTVTESISFEGIALRSEILLTEERESTRLPESGQRIPAGYDLGENEKAECSSLYFSDTDGYEYLSIDEKIFSAGTPGRLLSSEKRNVKNCGRLMTGRFWYCAAYADGETDACRCKVQFNGVDERIEGEIICCCSDSDGKTAVLMKFHLGKNEFLSLRFCSGEIMKNEITGLRLPVSALNKDSEGNYFVNRLTAAGEKPCPVEIIYKSEEFYLIKPTEELYAGVRVETHESPESGAVEQSRTEDNPT